MSLDASRSQQKCTSAVLPSCNFTLDLNSSNMPLAWRNFKTSLNIYMIANNLEEASDHRKVAILLHTMGTESLTIFYSFNVEIDKITFKDLLSKFESYFLPKVNITLERHKLFNRKQGPEEEIETYATDLKNISLQCNFEHLRDEIVKDIFSWNLNSAYSYIRERILIDKPTSFDAAVNLARTMRNTKMEAKALSNNEVCTIRTQSRSTRYRQKSPNQSVSRQQTSSEHSYNRQQSPRSSQNRQQSPYRQGQHQSKCVRCGQIHKTKCPAMGVTCHICSKPNHYAKCCRSKYVRLVQEESINQSGTTELVPPYRMPPAPEAALPGAPAPSNGALHTHSAKFPIEREVILSSCDKNSKVPILQDARKRGRLGAVAPDTPPKALSAWTHTENQQAGTSGEFRQYEQNYGYAMHQNNPNQGAVARSIQNYDSPKPPVPAKNTYKPDQNNSHITVTVETGKDNTKDAPKSNKSVSKTYHTLKDMISSRFKNKDGNDGEKNNEEARLNNIEERKKPEPEQITPRETPRKVEQGIYGRPMPQNRPDMQYSPGIPNNMAYHSPSPHRQLIQHQQQIVQQQMLLNHQARSQEMLAHRPQALGADALYQYGPPGRRSAVYQREDLRSLANFTSLKTGPQPQFENSHSRLDLRSPQQLERDVGRQRGLGEGRRAASHPHLLEGPQQRPEICTPQGNHQSRRNSQANLLDGTPNENNPMRNNEERESDDGGFRMRHATQSRLSFEERIRTSGRSIESHHERSHEMYRRTPDSHKESRRTPDSHKESRRTPDSLCLRQKEEPSTSREIDNRNDESASQKSADSVYNSSGKTEPYIPQPSSSRQTPNRIEDLKAHSKKGPSGSGASSDYDKPGCRSSNVDSGRGSAANSSGRRAEPPRAPPHAPAAPENEWADLVECELRQILEPKLSGMRLDSSASSDGSVTPPLPPLSPSSDLHKRNSLPGRPEYSDDRRRRESPRWAPHTHAHPHAHSHKKTSKRDHHYKKHSFGPDTTDVTSTTTRSLDLSSLLDARSDSEASGDARAIRRQLRGLEAMYGEVLQLLGVRRPARAGWEARLSSKRRYGSMSSLPSSSVSSRPVRDKRRSSNEHRKKNDYKGINKRFQRLESHVVTLARSVAHLSSEMRTHHLVLQEMDSIRAELAALRHLYRSSTPSRRRSSPGGFSDPARVRRLTKFFGDEPPLMRLFLKRLGYEKYAALLEKEKVGAAELPYVGEDRLRALGVPLGPRMRILKEAGIHQDLQLSRDDHNTTTTLAIV